MKILYIYEHFDISGGIPKIQTQKANYLSEEDGYEVVIITDVKNINRHFFPLNDNIQVEYIQFYHPDFKKSLLNIIKKNQPDVVSCIADTKEFFFLGKEKSNYKKIAEFHTNYRIIRGFSNIKYNFKNWVKERIRLFRFLESAKKYDTFVVLTQDDKFFFMKYFNSIKVIPNPIQKENPYLNHFSKSAIAIGRLEPVKGFDKLIDIWKIVSLKYPDWQLNIFGEGPLRDDLNKKIKDLQLEKNITIHKPIIDIYKEYAQSSMHLMTSRYEGFGNVLIEAMSSSIPSIAYNCGGGPDELIEHGKTGFLIPMGKPERFAEKIIEIIENKDLKIKMGHAAREKSKNYTITKIMNMWADILRK